MGNASVTYQGDGITKTFVVPFPFLSTAHVYVTPPATFSWPTGSTIQFAEAPTAEFKIQRVTPISSPMVVFDTTALSNEDLNLAILQLLYALQETDETLTIVYQTQVTGEGTGGDNDVLLTEMAEDIAYLYHNRNATTVTWTIAQGATTSDAVDLADRVFAVLMLPSGYDGGNITLQVATTLTGTYADLYTVGGTPCVGTVVGTNIAITGETLQALAGCRFVRLKCASAVAAQRSIVGVVKG
jgi:hypothetical protein